MDGGGSRCTMVRLSSIRRRIEIALMLLYTHIIVCYSIEARTVACVSMIRSTWPTMLECCICYAILLTLTRQPPGSLLKVLVIYMNETLQLALTYASVDLEYSLNNENENLQRRILDVNRQGAVFEEKNKALVEAEKALAMEKSSFLKSVNERESSLQHEILLMEENKTLLMAREKELGTAEESLKKREEVIEEKQASLIKLEQEVRERLKRVGDVENQSRELQNGNQ
eukprot:Gb_31722 [translate_table: standard]